MTKLFALAHVRLIEALRREEGQGTTEYVVLLAGIVVMAIAVTAALSSGLQDAIGSIVDKITGLLS
jgi:Flp pilus assembly pilin Flp